MDMLDPEDRKLAWALTKLIVVCVFCVMALLLVYGCAAIPLTHDQCNATKYATAMEHENCLRAAAKYEEEQHEKEDRRLIKRDKLIIFLNACDAHPDLVLMEVRRGGRSNLPNNRQRRRAIREHGYKFTHDNVDRRARQHDYKCVDPADILQQLGY